MKLILLALSRRAILATTSTPGSGMTSFPGWRDWDNDTSLIGVGSLITTNLELPAGRKVVVGAGAGYGRTPVLGPDWDVRFVRGPRTAASLELPGVRRHHRHGGALRAPAALLRHAGTGRRPILVPHWMSDRDPRYDWPAMTAAAGVDYLSPRGPSTSVIASIAAAPLVLAKSLHAAVIADAFRVPWRPVRSDAGSFKLFKVAPTGRTAWRSPSRLPTSSLHSPGCGGSCGVPPRSARRASRGRSAPTSFPPRPPGRFAHVSWRGRGSRWARGCSLALCASRHSSAPSRC